MSKLLAVSIAVLPLLVAHLFAGRREPRRGLQRTVLLAITLSGAWVIAIVYLYFRLE